MRVERVLETCLYASDLSAAERFYTQVLGLPVISREEGRHVFFRCEEGVFLVFNPESTLRQGDDIPSHGCRGSGHVAFRISNGDVSRWKEHLTRMGVGIEKEQKWPNGGRSLYFRDPAGNCVEVASPSIWGLES